MKNMHTIGDPNALGEILFSAAEITKPVGRRTKDDCDPEAPLTQRDLWKSCGVIPAAPQKFAGGVEIVSCNGNILSAWQAPGATPAAEPPGDIWLTTKQMRNTGHILMRRGVGRVRMGLDGGQVIIDRECGERLHSFPHVKGGIETDVFDWSHFFSPDGKRLLATITYASARELVFALKGMERDAYAKAKTKGLTRRHCNEVYFDALPDGASPLQAQVAVSGSANHCRGDLTDLPQTVEKAEGGEKRNRFLPVGLFIKLLESLVEDDEVVLEVYTCDNDAIAVCTWVLHQNFEGHISTIAGRVVDNLM